MPEPGALGGGFSAGMMQSQLDLQAIQQGQQRIELGKYQLAEAPIKLQEEQMQLQKDKIQMAQQMHMLSLMQNLKPPSDVSDPGSMSSTLMQMADIYMQSGMPDAAGKMAKEASTLMENQSKIDSRSYRIQNDRLSKFSNILNSVPDTPQGWTEAIQQMVAGDPGVAKDKRFVSLAQQPWQPGMMEKVKAGVLTLKDQVEVNLKTKQAAHAQTAMELDELRKPLIRAETNWYNRRADNIGKEGGLKPKEGDLKYITDQAKADHNTADDAEIRVRSRPLLDEMNTMMRTHPGMTKTEAATRVYQQNKGVFAGMRDTVKLPGSAPDKPLVPPKRTSGMTKEEWGKKFQVNQWYPQGLWDGTQFLSEAEVAAKSGAGRSDDDDTDDDDAD